METRGTSGPSKPLFKYEKVDASPNNPTENNAVRDFSFEDPNFWINLLLEVVYFPKWFFSTMAALVLGTNETEIVPVKPKQIATSGPGPGANLPETTPALIAVPEEEPMSWPFSTLDGLLTTLFSHYPATLTIGSLEKDFSLISIVLLSTFIGCLTSLFFIFIHEIYWNHRWIRVLKTMENSVSKKRPRKPRSRSRISLDTTSMPENCRDTPPPPEFMDVEQDEEEDKNGECGSHPDINGNLPEVLEDHSVILHQYPRGRHTPCADAQGLKMETIIRLGRLRYNICFDACNSSGPWLEVDGHKILDPPTFTKSLADLFPFRFAQLIIPRRHRVKAHLINLHVQHDVCRLLFQWGRFHGVSSGDSSNFPWAPSTEECLESADNIWSTENSSMESLVQCLDNSLNILSEILGSKKYFLGSRITELDISVFAVLAQALWAMPTTTIEGLITGKTNLVNFCHRIRGLSWTDWPENLWQDEREQEENSDSPSMTTNDAIKNTDNKDEGHKRRHKGVRTRTRTYKHSTVPFYCPPGISMDTPCADSITPTMYSAREEDGNTLVVAHFPSNIIPNADTGQVLASKMVEIGIDKKELSDDDSFCYSSRLLFGTSAESLLEGGS